MKINVGSAPPGDRVGLATYFINDVRGTANSEAMSS
jgi:hypothetical protein